MAFKEIEEQVRALQLQLADLRRSATAPAGSVAGYAGTVAPEGWLFPIGQSLLIASYPALFAALGTRYGGDGTLTFLLPDYRGRALVGVDAGQTEFNTLGKAGGAKTHTLTVAEMPNHSHNPPVAVVYNGNASAHRSVFATNSPFWNAAGDANNAVSPTGGGGAHNNLQPYRTIHFIIKT